MSLTSSLLAATSDEALDDANVAGGKTAAHRADGDGSATAGPQPEREALVPGTPPSTGTSLEQGTSGIAQRWDPWIVGTVVVSLCIAIAVARRLRRRKARRAAELAWARRGVISWSNVRTPDLTGFRPDMANGRHRPLPQLSVRIPDPAAESPAWLGAGVTVHHDTGHATGLSVSGTSSELESSLGWTLVGGAMPSLTYRMKGLPIAPTAVPKTLQPVVVPDQVMLAGHSAEPPAEGAAKLSDVGVAPADSVDPALPEITEAGKESFVPLPENQLAEPAAVMAVNAVDTSTGAPGTSIHGDTLVGAASQPANDEPVTTLLDEAKRLLASDRPNDAIAALQPVLSSAEVTGEAWTIYGWAQWRVASDGGAGPEHAREAAHAFEQALKAEPQRINLLSRMIGRCHMLCVQQLNGQERVNTLDQAVQALHRVRIGGKADHALDLELASALYERAMVSPYFERASWLDRVQHLIDSMPAREGLEQGWLQANTLWARADLVDSRVAQTLHERAFALVQRFLPTLDVTQRDVWLTRLIDGERAHLQRISRAARIIRLQQIQPAIQAQLNDACSIAPLLSWISVLGDWADSLQGAAAPAKLDETEPLFARIQTMVPENSGSLNFAHAYYLRMRAQRELSKSGRDAALGQAEQLLERVGSDQLPQALVQMEAAEIHLARARLADGAVAEVHYAEAAALGTAAAQAPENEARALTCALTAQVALQSHRFDEARVTPMRLLATRLLSLTPTDACALRLVAWVHFFAGEHGQASEFCEAAWNAGAHRGDILPIWQQADRLWAHQLDEPDQHRQWKRLHQRMRMANSSS